MGGAAQHGHVSPHLLDMYRGGLRMSLTGAEHFGGAVWGGLGDVALPEGAPHGGRV